MPVRLRSLLAPLALALAAALAAPAPASARVPADWAGTMINWEPLLASAPLLGEEFGRMRGSGIGHVRAALYWDQAQPYRNLAEVPAAKRSRFTVVDGIPTDFSAFDRVLDRASRQRLKVLPVVLGSPSWTRRARRTPVGFRPIALAPDRPADYGRFLTVLVRRYGPRGSFWAERPGAPYRPLRAWQIWNEPNLPDFWPQPFARSFVRLLRESRRALRAADPGAQLVLAGLTGVSWERLKDLYRAGAKGLFDVLAVHPFTSEPRNVLRILTRLRGIMADRGDLRPLMVTELTWPAAVNRVPRRLQYGFETTERGAARRLAEAFRLLALHRRRLDLRAVFWYGWMTAYRSKGDSFDYAGLRIAHPDGRREDKPVLGVFRRVVRSL